MHMNGKALLYQQIVENAQDAIIFRNRDGFIEIWNTGAERIFGYKAKKAVGQSFDIIIPEKLRASHTKGYHKVMATGSTRYGKELLGVPGVRKNGVQISIEFSILLVRFPSGEVWGAAAIIPGILFLGFKKIGPGGLAIPASFDPDHDKRIFFPGDDFIKKLHIRDVRIC